MTTVRKGQAPPELDRQAFHERFMQSYFDPAFRAEDAAIARLEQIAWEAYHEYRKAPVTQPAGPGFADPTYELSVEWRATRDKLLALQGEWSQPQTPSRVLLVCGSSRNDGTCPGEISKTFRLVQRMADIYEMWTRAHGVILVTPVYWYQAASAVKLMMDRMVCADGGNPDPTSTHGKNPEQAKQLELKGWPYPKHLAGRTYGLVVHGDVAGIEGTRRALCDWLDWMGLIDAGQRARLDRFIGYYEPYALSHDALDRDTGVQDEVRNVAHSVAPPCGTCGPAS